MGDWRVLEEIKPSKRVKSKVVVPCQCCGSLRRKVRALPRAAWNSFLKKNIFFHPKNDRFCVDCTKNLGESKVNLRRATKRDLNDILDILKSYVVGGVSKKLNQVMHFFKGNVLGSLKICIFLRKRKGRSQYQKKTKCRMLKIL